jgi:hypothetical protein
VEAQELRNPAKRRRIMVFFKRRKLRGVFEFADYAIFSPFTQ